jgi:hypothetical protein
VLHTERITNIKGKTMSYELADGSKSKDYKIGDKFTHSNGELITFLSDDGESNPWFSTSSDPKFAISWARLTPVKVKKNSSLINQLHATIRQLKATIAELES